ncbi:MAG: ParB/RepB/Spo0J family partition protein [Clostridiales bacterium]|nr:ParB/RepB/Spo0J family partition protein [Clostridiales bacterium]
MTGGVPVAERGLGTGLGALFGEAALQSDAVECVYMPITKVEVGLHQPREYFDENSLSELADSIRQHGIISPLTVRKLSSGYYQIVAGERRWRAARLAGLDQIPVRIIEADDKTAMEIALIENLQREDLNPIEEANGYKTLMEEYGFTQEKTAERVGKSRPAIANAMRLLALPASIVTFLENGSLSSGHGRALLSLKNEKDQLALAERIIEDGLSVRQVEAMVRKALNRDGGKNSEITGEQRMLLHYIEDLQQKLTARLGRKIKITSGKKRGRLEIEYYGNEDLEKIIGALQTLGGNENTTT